MSLQEFFAYRHGWEDGANSGRWLYRYPPDSELERIYLQAWCDGTEARTEAFNRAAKRFGMVIGSFQIG